MDLGNWLNDTCFVDVKNCEQGEECVSGNAQKRTETFSNETFLKLIAIFMINKSARSMT